MARCRKCGKQRIESLGPILFESAREDSQKIELLFECQDCGYLWIDQ